MGAHKNKGEKLMIEDAYHLTNKGKEDARKILAEAKAHGLTIRALVMADENIFAYELIDESEVKNSIKDMISEGKIPNWKTFKMNNMDYIDMLYNLALTNDLRTFLEETPLTGWKAVDDSTMGEYKWIRKMLCRALGGNEIDCTVSEEDLRNALVRQGRNSLRKKIM